MYESKTYETILSQCLSQVQGTVDTREGSILYDALAPACAQLAMLYTELATMLERAFPDTAMGVDLERKASERGLSRQEATCAVRQAAFCNADGNTIQVDIGKRFSGGSVNFWVCDKENAYLMAETAGDVGNQEMTTLFPIDYVADLASATMGATIIPGEDSESDEGLRSRYFASFAHQSFGGNVAEYRSRTEEMDGVGGAKILRASGGGGTVGVVIVGSDWAVPSDTLVSEVQTALDPLQNQGAGVGLAPIGHTVTVSPAQEKEIAVSFDLTLANDTTWSNLQDQVEGAIQAYFTQLTQVWAGSDALIVRISQLETQVLAINGVVDITDTKLNGVAQNITLDDMEIPVLEGVSLT